MRLPAEIRDPLDAALEERGLGRIRAAEPVGGGCIAETARLRTGDGQDYFLKWCSGAEQPVGLFAVEAAALGAIGATGAVRVPAVVHVHDGEPGATTTDSGGRWLLLEWLDPGVATGDTWIALGRQLADMHRHRANAPGWPTDNFIGTLPQANAAEAGWPGFWRERRLRPQLERALGAGLLDGAEVPRFERLLASLDEILEPAARDGASLLHGDLWSGNLHVMRTGDPALVDPASYYGHREVDLAMSELFGGFEAAFLEAYEEVWPLEPGYAERRRSVYQLYYLLVHVNLFGASYRSRTLSTLRSAGF